MIIQYSNGFERYKWHVCLYDDNCLPNIHTRPFQMATYQRIFSSFFFCHRRHCAMRLFVKHRTLWDERDVPAEEREKERHRDRLQGSGSITNVQRQRIPRVYHLIMAQAFVRACFSSSLFMCVFMFINRDLSASRKTEFRKLQCRYFMYEYDYGAVEFYNI